MNGQILPGPSGVGTYRSVQNTIYLLMQRPIWFFPKWIFFLIFSPLWQFYIEKVCVVDIHLN